jgi:hypothetical protein
MMYGMPGGSFGRAAGSFDSSFGGETSLTSLTGRLLMGFDEW